MPARIVLAEAGEVVGLGDFLADNWDEILVGGASVAGFALRGTPWGIAVGAAVGGITAAVQGEDFEGILLGTAYGAVGGVFGAAGFGVKGATRAAQSMDMARALTGTAAQKAAINKGLLGVLPTKLGGAHVAPWRSYMGLAGAFTTGWTADGIRNTVGEHLGYPAIPLIDISEQELSDIPEDMPHIYMPDPHNLPEGLEFTTPMQRNFRTLPPFGSDSWISFGTKPREADDLPKEIDVTEIFGAEHAGIPDYAHHVEVLRDRYTRIRSRIEIVAEAVKRSAALCQGGRYDLASSIITQNKYAGTDPRDLKNLTALLAEHNEKPSEASGMPVFYVDPQRLGEGLQSEDAYTFVLIESGYANVETIMSYYAGQFEEVAAEVRPEASDDEDSGSKQEDRSADNSSDSGFDPAAAGGADGAAAEQPADTDPGRVPAPEPWDLGADAGSSGTDDSGAGAATDSGSGPDTPDARGTEAAGSPVATQPGPTPAPSQNAMSSALQAMLLPQLMRGALGNQQDGSGDRPRTADEGSADSGTATALRPGVVAAPSPGQPSPGQNTGSPAAPAVPAKTVSPPPDSSPPPGRTTGPAESGRVVYTFPDGRTQEVSVVVAHGLDLAFGNAAGTDAQAAYAGTAAGWTDPKRIGARVDPAQLTTGDVGVWENRTALLVVFPGESAAEATVEAVVAGALQRVTSLAEMRDGAGEFGAFGGFFHPPGTEAAGAADRAGDAAASPAAADVVVPA